MQYIMCSKTVLTQYRFFVKSIVRIYPHFPEKTLREWCLDLVQYINNSAGSDI